MRIRNLTGAPVRLKATPDGEVVTLPVRGVCRAVPQGELRCAPLEGVENRIARSVGLRGLPEPEEGTFYLLPAFECFLAAGAGRWDVACLDERSLRRSPSGEPLWHESLLSFHPAFSYAMTPDAEVG